MPPPKWSTSPRSPGTSRLQLRQHRERLLSAGGDLVTPHQLRQQVDGCSNQLDLLGKEVKMLRKELARYPITSEKVTADSIDYGSGKGWKLVGLVGCLALGGWLCARK